jgi:hypothetical protein
LIDKEKYKDPSLKDELIRVFTISFSVFLFILFFQPFPLELLEYNDRLLYVTGFGAIIFLLSSIIYIMLPLLIPARFKVIDWENGPPLSLNLLLLLLSVTSFSFYIRYVGETPLGLYIVFKTVLICLLPMLALTILYRIKSLEEIIRTSQERIKKYREKIMEYEKVEEDREIQFGLPNMTDKLSIKLKNILAIKAADNYVEIIYKADDRTEKKLIRNTLKNIEEKLIESPEFIRCHRASLINTRHIEKLVRSYSGYSLKLKGLEELIPVSRQYLIQIKEVITSEK